MADKGACGERHLQFFIIRFAPRFVKRKDRSMAVAVVFNRLAKPRMKASRLEAAATIPQNLELAVNIRRDAFELALIGQICTEIRNLACFNFFLP